MRETRGGTKERGKASEASSGLRARAQGRERRSAAHKRKQRDEGGKKGESRGSCALPGAFVHPMCLISGMSAKNHHPCTASSNKAEYVTPVVAWPRCDRGAKCLLCPRHGRSFSGNDDAREVSRVARFWLCRVRSGRCGSAGPISSLGDVAFSPASLPACYPVAVRMGQLASMPQASRHRHRALPW